jgi:ATP-dependent RNA helicase DBP3
MVGNTELAASHTVTQIVEVLAPDARDAALLKLLGKYHASRKNRVLVFVLYKKEAARMERVLQVRARARVDTEGDGGGAPLYWCS